MDAPLLGMALERDVVVEDGGDAGRSDSSGYSTWSRDALCFSTDTSGQVRRRSSSHRNGGVALQVVREGTPEALLPARHAVTLPAGGGIQGKGGAGSTSGGEGIGGFASQPVVPTRLARLHERFQLRRSQRPSFALQNFSPSLYRAGKWVYGQSAKLVVTGGDGRVEPSLLKGMRRAGSRVKLS